MKLLQHRQPRRPARQSGVRIDRFRGYFEAVASPNENILNR